MRADTPGGRKAALALSVYSLRFGTSALCVLRTYTVRANAHLASTVSGFFPFKERQQYRERLIAFAHELNFMQHPST
jgi:hypothetical protein